MGGIRDFFSMFHRRQGKEDKGGGQRSIEDQNAYDAVMAALNSNELTTARLGRLLTQTLSVSHRQITRGRAFCKNMEDLDKARWIRKPSTVPSNAIKEGKIQDLVHLHHHRIETNNIHFIFLFHFIQQNINLPYLSLCIQWLVVELITMIKTPR